MKAIMTKIAIVVFFMACLVPCVHAADVAKIGVVDFQRFMKESEIGKAAWAKMDKETSRLEAELEEKANSLEALKKQLERDLMVMSDDKKEQQEREYRIQMNDLKTLQRKYSEKLGRLDRRLSMELQEKAFTLAQEIGKKEGYLLLVEKTSTLYYPQAIDVTDKLIEMANAQNLSLDDKNGSEPAANDGDNTKE
ncbi:MAG: OmpH family outer membrane protein [Thermodesulfobacteriota bacterium]|nr:OmpH family outer membrane protein [Thermodesulfobacteriota bacterium]